MKIGLFGTGAYGMALSSILVENNCEVVLWTKFEEEKIFRAAYTYEQNSNFKENKPTFKK